MPPPVEAPERLSVIAVLALPLEGEAVADPAVGLAEHALAPLPVTATVTAEARLHPVIVMLPEYEVIAVGEKRTRTAALENDVPVDV